MAFLANIGPTDAQLGGKARSLAQLAAAGLATPPGFVVGDALFRALCPPLPAFRQLDSTTLDVLDTLRARIADAPWPAGFQDELHTRLGLMTATSYSVRSSFADEDTAGYLGAGVYESRVGVACADVEKAIREVLASVLSPGAVAYALARGREPASVPVAVLVHAFVAGEAEGSAAFAEPAMAAMAAIAAMAAMDSPLVTLRRGHLPAEVRAELQSKVRSLAQAHGPVEIEWVWTKEHLVYLQARPFQPPPAPVPWLGWNDLGDEEDVARESWSWDAAHNPLPLSPAQAGLVALVDGCCSIGVRQRVLGGYLFYRRDDSASTARQPSHHVPVSVDGEAASSYFESLRGQADAQLTALGPHPSLEAALALFVSFYEPIFAVLQPALRRIHKRFHAFLADHAPAGLALLPWLRAGVSSMASERRTRAAKLASAQDEQTRNRALGEYLALFGDEAPVWDVCVPTYAELPSALLPAPSTSAVVPDVMEWQRASAEVEAILAPSLREEWTRLLRLEREAVALGEADDWLYARVQAAVRRAFLATGHRLGANLLEPDDVFFLPFDVLRGLANGRALPPDLGSSAQLGRAAWEQARRQPPPSPSTGEASVVHGFGTAGRAIGRVVWHRADVRASMAVDAVLVAKTLLPTELPLVSAAAIVTETGGPLDHVAAQARERSIPAVVGARGASTLLSDGDLVLVDGDRGLVVRLLGRV